MDCDGKKKIMLQDMDGTLLGSIATVIPDSGYEWDGDPRRGIGDYRIPKVMVTEPDGSRIQYEDKMPNKGICNIQSRFSSSNLLEIESFAIFQDLKY